ncbi:MAG TPA: hypothetical protein VGP93_02620, partial [Polyangiaceae bacterium]|nr:hypothetical protein [Polyangiaceae bacterium]
MGLVKRLLSSLALCSALVGCSAAPDPSSSGSSAANAGSANSTAGRSNAGAGGAGDAGAASGGKSSFGGTTSGGTTSAAGTSSGGMNTAGAASGGSAPFVPPACDAGSFELPANAPELTPGIWTPINPQGLVFGTGDALFTQGMALDPCNPATLYLCAVAANISGKPIGVYRSVDAGSTWTELGAFDSPIRVRVDPRDPLHLYVVDGVQGGTKGFWVSKDGGQNWYRPQSFQDLGNTTLNWDTYYVEPDPADFNHVLVTFHNAWQAPYDASGLIESTDGGDSWVVHDPKSSWYTGHDVFFLYNPALGIGDSKTWLL